MLKVWRRNWTSTARRYAEADAIVVSLGKSGRTWLKVFLYSYFCALEKREFTLDPKDLAASKIPKLVFTHDLWGSRTVRKLKDRITGKQLIPPLESRTKPILLLVRDPRDVIVSLFFQITRRSRRYRGVLSEMIRHPKFGIHSIIDVMNTWIEEWGGRSDFKLLRYEDCRTDTKEVFRGVLVFLGFTEIDVEAFHKSLEFSSFENMKAMEAASRFNTGILQPGNPVDPESFKVRRGLVGGYREYLNPEDILFLDHAVTRLDKRYGYGRQGDGAPGAISNQ